MTLLTLGVLLWMAAHFLKRLAPGVRAGMDSKFGAGGARGMIAGALAVSLVLMIVGFRGAGHTAVYTPMAGMGHLNNLLMIVAVILLGAGSSKGKMRSLIRHPMLTGVLVWAVAHLLVNGDQAALILFGGMAVWAILEIILINRAEGPWQRPEPGPVSGDIRLLIISAVVFTVIVLVHNWLGYSPFLGTYG